MRLFRHGACPLFEHTTPLAAPLSLATRGLGIGRGGILSLEGALASCVSSAKPHGSLAGAPCRTIPTIAAEHRIIPVRPAITGTRRTRHAEHGRATRVRICHRNRPAPHPVETDRLMVEPAPTVVSQPRKTHEPLYARYRRDR